MSQLSSFLIQNINVSQILSFGFILLCVLMITRRLLYRLIYAFEPESKSLHFVMKPRIVRVAISLADIGAWVLAVIISCLVHEMPVVTNFLLSLFGIILNLLTLTIVILLLIYSFSRTGNELILSVIGAWYLRYRKKILDGYDYFDLGEGIEAEIVEINFLDTTFRLKKGGGTLVRSNAFLMHEVFGFTRAIGIEEVFYLWHRSKRNNFTEKELEFERESNKVKAEPRRDDWE